MPPVLREFCWVTLLLTSLSIAYCVFMAVIVHRHYPYNWPFFIPKERFTDFTSFTHKFQFFHQAAFFTTDGYINYPALMALVYEVFYKLGGHHALGLFLTVIVMSFVVPAILFGRALVKRGLSKLAATAIVGIGLVLSWPALLILDRANVEFAVWIALASGAWAYARKKEWTAAAMFGVATALKLFPFVYLALFFSWRKYPKFFFGILTFGVINLVSLAILGPTIPIAYHGLAAGMGVFRGHYMATYLFDEGGIDHSLLAFIKASIAVILQHPGNALATATALYFPLSAIGGLLLYFLRIRKMPWLNQLLALSIASIYLTPFSGDGTLVHLYYSFALCSFVAIDAWRRQIEIPGMRTMFLCFAWLFSIESFLIMRGYRREGQFKCIVLGILLIWALRYPLGPPKDSEPADELAFPDASLISTAKPLSETVA